SLEVDDYGTGLSFINESRTEESIPTLTNIRIRHTTNTSRTEAVALKATGKVNMVVTDFETENVPNGISIYSGEDTIPTLTNIRIRHTTNTSRELGGKALEFVGSVSPHLTEVIVEDYLTGISFDNTNRSGETIPTLTNIRIRHTTNTSRTEAVALKSVGNVNLVVTDFESENVQAGISIYSDEESIPTLTNIRIRHTTNTSRALGGTGIELNGLIQAVIDDVEVDDYITGILLENITRTEETIPTLTNIRIRHTTNTSRTDAIALKSVGFINLNLTDFESENVKDGINIYANEETIPTLTNIRIRHTTNTSRNIGVGLTLNHQTNIMLTNALIEGFATGLKISGTNSSIIERNTLLDNQVAIELSEVDCLPQIQHNHIENSLANSISCFAMSNISNIQILNNNILGYTTVLTGEYSSPYFSQNIMWGAVIQANELFTGTQLAPTFAYNDISLAQGLAPGIGNINADPLFVEQDGHDLALSIYSPCIDAGNPNLARDPDGSIADIGMNYVHHLVQYSSTSRFGTTGTEVQFNNKAEGHDNAVTTILWDFGDGNTSIERNPLHIYDSAGLYDVTLTMTTGSYTDLLYRENFVIAQPNVLNAPQNPAATIIGNGLKLTWEEITQTISGSPVANLTYLIYSCADPLGIYEYRANVANLTWTDQNIAQQGSNQFYFIIGYSSTGRSSLEEFINTHRYLKRDGEVIQLNSSKK
ncbi:MAG: PKD domain-containing protein, partial [Candidatus Cloacimonadales bacterium]